ncbi:MAG: ABC transporter permease [Synergistaceae bacterium]|jgi:putative ABC transport system permease protein|nr:ABC transporter permease [Synergistaceae bacterium]
MRQRRLNAFNISLQNLRRRPFRNFCIAGFVALLSFVLITGSLLAFGLRSGMSSMSDRLGADLILAPRGYRHSAEGVLLRGEPSAFYLDASALDRISGIRGLSRTSPQLFIASLDSSHCSFPVQLIGYEPDTDFVIAPWLGGEVPGTLAFGEVVVGSQIDAAAGDRLMFFSSEYRVAARLEKTGMGFDTSVFFNMETARAALKEYFYYTGEDGRDVERAASIVTADVGRGIDPAAFAREIHDEMRLSGVDVIRPQDVIGEMSRNLNLLTSVILALTAILWLLAVGVLTVLFAVILNERKGEFGIYRVLGATVGWIARFVLLEASLVSLFGALSGAFAFCLLILPFRALIDLNMILPYIQPRAGASALLAAAGFFLSFLVGPLASLYSVLRIGPASAASALGGE